MPHRLALAAAPLALALSACVVVVDAAPSDSDFGVDARFAGQGRAEAGELLAAEATLDAFTAVDASAGTKVILRPGARYAISLDDDARRRASYEVEDGTLSVTCRKRDSWFGNCLRGDRGTLTVTLPRAERLQVSSGARLELTEGVALADAVSLRASSGGSFEAKGSFGPVASIDAQASSGGSLNARRIEGRSAKAGASSGGSVRLGTIRDRIEAEASSGGSVRYAGDPQVDRHTSSGGSVRGR